MSKLNQEELARGGLMALFTTVQILLRAVCELSGDENTRNVLINDILSMEKQRPFSPGEEYGFTDAQKVLVEFLQSL